jgi:hypothetical protein
MPLCREPEALVGFHGFFREKAMKTTITGLFTRVLVIIL